MRAYNILFCIFGCILFTACQSPKSYTPDLTPEEIRSEEVSQQKMVDEIAARGGRPKPWKNPKNMRKQFETVGEAIEKAGAEICLEMKLQKNGCYYYFRLSRDEDINSHADGKNIVVYTGMMRFVESDDELAVVMSHEFAHNLMQHVSAQKNNATIGMLVGLAVDAFADSEGIDTNNEITKAATELAISTYSADFEKEADYVGLYILERAGYDITAAPKFWRKMSVEDPDSIYVSTTHPSNAERFVALQKAIYEVDYKKKHNLALVPDFK